MADQHALKQARGYRIRHNRTKGYNCQCYGCREADRVIALHMAKTQGKGTIHPLPATQANYSQH